MMTRVGVVSYHTETHSEAYYDMLVEYGLWLDREVMKHYGEHRLNIDDKNLFKDVFKRFTSIKPPEGDIIILEVHGEAAAMARFSTLEEGIGEVNNVYTRPEFRRRGYTTRIKTTLEETARNYGFSIFRLDTAGFNKPAQNLYKKLGYNEIVRYSKVDPTKSEAMQRYDEEKMYMEKKL